MPDATDVAALRTRHQQLVTRQAELEGRLQQRREHHESLLKQMRDQYGCNTVEQLQLKITETQATVAAAYTAAEAAIAAAEAALQDVAL